MMLALDLIDGPYETDKAPGTGGDLCSCGNHRVRCAFGRQHVWATAYHAARLVRTPRTFSCHVCGAICFSEEDA